MMLPKMKMARMGTIMFSVSLPALTASTISSQRCKSPAFEINFNFIIVIVNVPNVLKENRYRKRRTRLTNLRVTRAKMLNDLNWTFSTLSLDPLAVKK